MRIALDARSLNVDHLRGMGKVLRNVLATALASSEDEFVLLADEPRHPLHAPDHPRVTTRVWEQRGDRLRLWEQMALPAAAQRMHCDVLHATGTWAPVWQPVPTVVTLHDTIPWDEEDAVAGSRPTAFTREVLLPAAYRRARAIVTPSQHSRHDILRHWPELEPRLHVVPWGIDAAYHAARADGLPEALLSRGIRAPYLLYMGGDIPRKRLAWAMRAWAAGTAPGVQLVACGVPQDAWPHVASHVPAGRREEFRPQGFLDEAVMPALHAHAAATLYPTRYEGFGFPALEAQAAGRPVLISAVSSLRELCGPSAVVLPADDFDAWVSACRTLTAHVRPDDAASRAWARAFSWSATTTRLLEIYRAAARPQEPKA